MTLVLLTWCPDPAKPAPCANTPCQPSHPHPPNGGGGGGGTGLPPFTDAVVNINQIQINTDKFGQQTRSVIGSMAIYSAIDNIPPQGKFGSPYPVGPVEISSIVNSIVKFESFITIRHPFYPSGSYNSSLPAITTAPLETTASDPGNLNNNAASITAGNAAIGQANQILGNPP